MIAGLGYEQKVGTLTSLSQKSFGLLDTMNESPVKMNKKVPRKAYGESSKIRVSIKALKRKRTKAGETEFNSG